MHYKNGRPAKAGDKVINLESGLTGLLHSPSAESEYCNGRLALISPNDPYVTTGECLHLDDVEAATIPDSSVPAQTETEA